MVHSAADHSYQEYLNTHHFGSLDGLRFICIAAVIWHHGLLWQHLIGFSPIFGRGYTGVDFFFVLSGFLITTLLLRERSKKGQFDLRGFYWRRVLRIVPVYFLVVTVAGVLAALRASETAELLPFYYLFLSNFLTEHIPLLTVTWSLSMEEQYYLVWPVLLMLLPARWAIPVLVGFVAVNLAAVLGALAPLGIHPAWAGPLRFAMPASTYAPLLMGSLAAILLHQPHWFDRISPLLAPRIMPWLLFTALAAVLANWPEGLAGWPNLLMHALMTLILMSLVVREDNGMHRILCFAPIARVGQISYGIYLYHLFALSAVVKILRPVGLENQIAIMIIYPALAVFVAEISFRTYERWFLGLRHKGLGRV
ncbi:acyltransferase family protein [Rhodovulum visakhapatnamense]|uniref:Peptidoglycan/LPS O-acetylase OafA/YrhL n=1 Tax=Rhodovulum visakhapatnamense TaxID=364297 RepID=A0A4R8FGA7_9RHOB|nr:acyltransferase [Rhodovulum visakhapatnamense]TDX21877.1 peptidoglycan/LPS O-acetylase OafA/YrhL [Rhodovulum visakhapatnamense]